MSDNPEIYTTSIAHIDSADGMNMTIYFSPDRIRHFTAACGSRTATRQLKTMIDLIRDFETEADLLNTAGENGFEVARFALDPTYISAINVPVSAGDEP